MSASTKLGPSILSGGSISWVVLDGSIVRVIDGSERNRVYLDWDAESEGVEDYSGMARQRRYRYRGEFCATCTMRGLNRGDIEPSLGILMMTRDNMG